MTGKDEKLIDENVVSCVELICYFETCTFLLYKFDVYFKNNCNEHISGWLNLVYPIQLINSVITLK